MNYYNKDIHMTLIDCMNQKYKSDMFLIDQKKTFKLYAYMYMYICTLLQFLPYLSNVPVLIK